MTDEVTQPQPSTEPAASTEAPAQQETSLEDVFKSYQIEYQPAETQQHVPQPQPQQQPARQEAHIPDPALDPEGFRRYEATRAAETQALRQASQQVIGYISKMERERIQEREEADIAKAVGFLAEKAPGVDPEILEVYLGAKAKKDPRLLQVWNNRSKNPKAWDAALKAIGNEAAGKFEVRTDGQLVENQRAMKAAQQTMATAQPTPTREERMGQLQGAEFDREWERVRQG